MTVSAPARLSEQRPATIASPPARRPHRPGWRDPRLAVGVLLLCGSVLLGARVLATADDTAAVWGARTALTRGQQVGAADLVAVRVRFDGAEAADRYVAADAGPPEGMALTRDVGAGELLPRAALVGDSEAELVEVPLAVEARAVPASVEVGSRVDVWVTPAAGARAGAGSAEAVRVLEDVAVVADGTSAASATGFGSETRPVVVGVPPPAQQDLPRVLARLTDGTVVLVRRQG